MPMVSKEQFIIAALTGDMRTLKEGSKYYSATETTVSKPFEWLDRKLFNSKVRSNPLKLLLCSPTLSKNLVKSVLSSQKDWYEASRYMGEFSGTYQYKVNFFSNSTEDTEQYSALIAAVLGGNSQGLNYLLDNGAQPNIKIPKVVLSIIGDQDRIIGNYPYIIGESDKYICELNDMSLLDLSVILNYKNVTNILHQRLQSSDVKKPLETMVVTKPLINSYKRPNF